MTVLLVTFGRVLMFERLTTTALKFDNFSGMLEIV